MAEDDERSVKDGPGNKPDRPIFLRGLGPLRFRDYSLYLLGNGGSYIGSQAEIVAAAWVLYQLTGSAVLLGLNGLFQALPIFLMVPFAGTLADRLPRVVF